MHGIEMFGEAFDYTIDEKNTPAAKSIRVIVENLRGNTRINGADTAEVRVKGRKTVRSMTREAADEVNKTTALEVVQQGDSILIRTNQNRVHEERYVTSDLEISVPRGASIQARGRFGDFEINDVNGSVEIDSDNAGIRAQNIGGGVRANTRRSDLIRVQGAKGAVELQGRGNDVELENVEGQVTIDGSWGGELHFRNLAKPVRFQGMQAELQMQRVSGDVRVGRGFITGESVAGPVIFRGRSKGCCDVRLSDFNSSLELDVQRGDLELRPALPLPKIDVELRNGNVDLAIPKGAKFSVKARVDKGEIENEYGDPLKLTSQDRGATLTGAVGDGSAISITTDRGRVVVRKPDDAPPASPLTPQPPPPAPPRPMTAPRPVEKPELD
jgi:hypothetical protein